MRQPENVHLVNVFQNDELAIQGVIQAHGIAKEAFYEAPRERWPSFLPWQNIRGPSFVRSSWSELQSVRGRAPEIRYELECFSRLRNFVCHPRVMDCLRTYDAWLTFAENLVKRLGEKERLRRIRDIRVPWKKEAELILAEVESRSDLFELPFNGEGVWNEDHVWLFKRVMCDSECRRADLYPPAVICCAKRWADLEKYAPRGIWALIG